MATEASDWIHLSKLAFPCVVGMLDREQRHTQMLEVEIGLNLDLDRAAGGDLSASVSYAPMAAQLQFIACHGKWRLLESLAAAMARHALAAPAPGEARAQVENVVVRVSKPDVLDGRAIPRVEIRRNRQWRPAASDAALGGETRIVPLQETAATGAYHVDLAPGGHWTAPAGTAVHVIAGCVAHDDRTLSPGESLERGGVELRNPGDVAARLLAVSQPTLGWEP